MEVFDGVDGGRGGDGGDGDVVEGGGTQRGVVDCGGHEAD